MSKKPAASGHKHRADIDGLRAVAVLSVLAFHAFPLGFPGGFVGVDIFFVISGFLISTILFEELAANTFSFSVFYFRRIRRIFPALAVVLLVCFVLGRLVFFKDENAELDKHIAAGAGFVSNLVLWGESGYFDTAAESKPLLHLWSLGIEEQFYIFWPITLFMLRKNKTHLLYAAVAILALSFGLNVARVASDPVATFYSPLSRLWELLCGAVLAWLTLYGPSPAAVVTSWPVRMSPDSPALRALPKLLSELAAWGALLLLAVSFLRINPNRNFPGKWALFPVLAATALIFAGPRAWFNRTILSHKLCVWIGLISYPLYLWHWPLLSFARIIESDTPSVGVRCAALVLAVLLAWLTFLFVERPLRFEWRPRQAVLALAGAMSLLAAVAFGLWTLESRPTAAQAETMRFLETSSANCDRYFPDWAKVTDNRCRWQKPAGNKIAIVGDSHAGQLFLGLSKQARPDDGVAVFAASCAAPFIDVASGQGGERTRNVRQGTYRLINRAYDYILHDASAKVVILAHNPACSYYDATDMTGNNAGDYRDVLKRGMARTFRALLAAGKEVLVVFDAPQLPYDPIDCNTRRLKLTSFTNRCSFPRTQTANPDALAAYRELVDDARKEYPQIKTVDLSNLFCDERTCRIGRDGRVLYRDRNHLSDEGSSYVAPYLLAAIGGGVWGGPRQ